jgi:hypothetical protein
MTQLDNPRRCAVADCFRKVVARGLCQTHNKHLKKLGAFRPIRESRPPRSGAVKLNGLSVTPACAEKLKHCAGETGLAVNAVITDVIEKWALRRHRRHQQRQKSEKPNPGTDEAVG